MKKHTYITAVILAALAISACGSKGSKEAATKSAKDAVSDSGSLIGSLMSGEQTDEEDTVSESDEEEVSRVEEAVDSQQAVQEEPVIPDLDDSVTWYLDDQGLWDNTTGEFMGDRGSYYLETVRVRAPEGDQEPCGIITDVTVGVFWGYDYDLEKDDQFAYSLTTTDDGILYALNGSSVVMAKNGVELNFNTGYWYDYGPKAFAFDAGMIQKWDDFAYDCKLYVQDDILYCPEIGIKISLQDVDKYET